MLSGLSVDPGSLYPPPGAMVTRSEVEARLEGIWPPYPKRNHLKSLPVYANDGHIVSTHS